MLDLTNYARLCFSCCQGQIVVGIDRRIGLAKRRRHSIGAGTRASRPPTPPPNPSTDPLLRGFEFRSLGPATMMGRVDDIAGSEQDPMLSRHGSGTGCEQSNDS